jgi:hypothetical protein
MAQVHAEQDHSQDIEATGRWALESENHHLENIMPLSAIWKHLSVVGKFRTDRIGREMQNMENHEAEDDEPTHHH